MKARATHRRRRSRWLIPGIVAASALVVAGGTALVFALTAPAAPAVIAKTSTPTPFPTPTGPPPFYAAASFGSWNVANEADVGTQFSVNGDAAADGPVSLRVDSTTTGPGRRALTQVVPAEPATAYAFSARVKSSSSTEEAAPVSITMGTDGAQSFELPVEAADWAEVSWSYTTGADQTEIPVAIVPGGAIEGFLIDQLRAVPAGGADSVVANGSFDDFSSPRYIANDTLVLESGSAGIDVAWFARAVDWAVTDDTGAPVTAGTLPLAGGVGTVPLEDLQQGYYRIALTVVGDSTPLGAAFMVLGRGDPGDPVSDERFGVGTHIGEADYVDSERVAARMGFSGMRTDAYWQAVETTPGEYAYPAYYESQFPAYEALGVSVLPISNGTNPHHDDDQIPHTAEGVQAYAAYTADLAEHYSLPAVEIYNEFNNLRFNNSECGSSPDCYMPLLSSSYAAVKAASPGTKIVGPANANQDDPWLTGLYAQGGLSYLDVVSYHPYVAAPEELVGNIQQAQARIAEYNNGQPKPIWLTEFGWTSNSGPDSEAMQARYLVRAETIALASGVEKLFWYDLVNDDPDPTDHEGNFGLFRPKTDAVRAFEPKPSGVAQGVLIRKLAGKPYTSQDSIADGVYSYAFGAGVSTTRVVWSTAPASVSFASTKPLIVTTGFGTATEVAPIDGQVTVQVADQPLYIDGAVTAAVVTPAG
ncbi:glycosyl hydrolase [Compostimonas suwonensis]|uniref:Putative glycosyl hydrolase n=1 Tax=Compostimonas suwonensis TaxID=1048394 RepID=A0A2M9C5D4_9MICO|nr:glycosyl hydrolase [Compostimonas suwonensis]PJJ65726.1 putative glycosyl hydrolase [Compostimonas suwonensis]